MKHAQVKETKRGWVVEYYDQDGKRRQYTKAKNKRHAEEWKDKYYRDNDEARSGRSITFGKAYKEFMEHQEERHRLKDIWRGTLHGFHFSAKHILPTTVKSGARSLGLVSEGKALHRVTSDDVQKFLDRLLKEPSPFSGKILEWKSVDNIKNDLGEFFKWCVKKPRKWLGRHPFTDDPVKVKGKRKKNVYIPKSEDIEELIKYMSESKPDNRTFLGWTNDKIAFAFCAFSGLRVGEVSALRWDHVDLAKTQFEIDAEFGSNSRVDGRKCPKSEVGARTLPICQFLYDALLDHAHEERSALDRMGYKHIGTRTGFVIKNAKNPDSPKPPDVSKITASHRQLMLDAQLIKPDDNIKFSTHKLRHWQISMGFNLGIPLPKISKRAGHSDPSTTTSIYSHVIDDDDSDHPSEVPQIWKDRFARAQPGGPSGLPRIIDGTINGSSILELEATEISSVTIPENAQPYVPLALKMLQGGWKPNQVTKHLGQSNSTLFRAFNKAGLEPPNFYVKQARERRYQELMEKGYGDEEIGRLTNSNHVTVLNWRRTKECGKPNTRKSLEEMKKERSEQGVFAGKFLEKQPKLL